MLTARNAMKISANERDRFDVLLFDQGDQMVLITRDVHWAALSILCGFFKALLPIYLPRLSRRFAIAARRDEFRPRFKSVLADLESVALGHEYLFEILTYADFCLFGTFTWITRVSDEPLFDSAPSLGKWWERMQARFEV